MKEKKIIFKLENDKKSIEIKGVDKVELLTFICVGLENLIQNGIVSRDILLTSINMCLTLGSCLSTEALEDKEISTLIDELSVSMLDLFKGIKND